MEIAFLEFCLNFLFENYFIIMLFILSSNEYFSSK